MPAIDPAQYVVAGGTLGAFAFVVKMMVRYQGSVTSVAFDRIDRLEKELVDARRELAEERAKCDKLEADHRKLSGQMWRLQNQLDRFMTDNDIRNDRIDERQRRLDEGE